MDENKGPGELLQYQDAEWWKRLDWHKTSTAFMHPKAGLSTAKGRLSRPKLGDPTLMQLSSTNRTTKHFANIDAVDDTVAGLSVRIKGKPVRVDQPSLPCPPSRSFHMITSCSVAECRLSSAAGGGRRSDRSAPRCASAACEPAAFG